MLRAKLFVWQLGSLTSASLLESSRIESVFLLIDQIFAGTYGRESGTIRCLARMGGKMSEKAGADYFAKTVIPLAGAKEAAIYFDNVVNLDTSGLERDVDPTSAGISAELLPPNLRFNKDFRVDLARLA